MPLALMSIVSPFLYLSRTFNVSGTVAFRIEVPSLLVNRNSWDFRKSLEIPDYTDLKK
jgi:hypothetical protein